MVAHCRAARRTQWFFPLRTGASSPWAWPVAGARRKRAAAATSRRLREAARTQLKDSAVPMKRSSRDVRLCFCPKIIDLTFVLLPQNNRFEPVPYGWRWCGDRRSEQRSRRKKNRNSAARARGLYYDSNYDSRPRSLASFRLLKSSLDTNGYKLGSATPVRCCTSRRARGSTQSRPPASCRRSGEPTAHDRTGGISAVAAACFTACSRRPAAARRARGAGRWGGQAARPAATPPARSCDTSTGTPTGGWRRGRGTGWGR